MRAFHSDPAVKTKYLRRIRAHMAADRLLQGYGYWSDGKGCAVGCTIQLNGAGTAHAAYEKELGIPAELAYLEDYLFERMETKLAREWPLRFLKAARTGADLTRVYDLWTHWNLVDPTDGVITLVTDEFSSVQKVIRDTAEDCLTGNRVNSEKAAWAARAADAAWAARAADVAWAARAADAARAAWAADAARAAWAADAARAAWAADAACAARAAWAADAARAADAAWAADAARAAWATYISRAANKLIELMEAAE